MTMSLLKFGGLPRCRRPPHRKIGIRVLVVHPCTCPFAQFEEQVGFVRPMSLTARFYLDRLNQNFVSCIECLDRIGLQFIAAA